MPLQEPSLRQWRLESHIFHFLAAGALRSALTVRLLFVVEQAHSAAKWLPLDETHHSCAPTPISDNIFQMENNQQQ